MKEGFFKIYRNDIDRMDLYHRDAKYLKVWTWLNDHMIFKKDSKKKGQVVLEEGLNTILNDLENLHSYQKTVNAISRDELRHILRTFLKFHAIFYQKIQIGMTIIVMPQAKSKIGNDEK